MNPSDATQLVRRLLAGERGSLPMHLGLLLEKSSPLRNNDDHYRKILPPELAEVELSFQAASEIISQLCLAISRNPDEAYLAAVSTTGSETVTKEVAKVLTAPPRRLTPTEYEQALGILYAFLPACLERDQFFLSSDERARLVQLLQELARTGTAMIKRHSVELLKNLTPTTR